MREPEPDAHPDTYTHTYPDTYGDTDMDRITHPYADALDDLALRISDLRSLAAAVHNTYGEPDEADRIYALASDLAAVLNKHRNPPRRTLVQRFLGG
jgi:hypothetical protein